MLHERGGIMQELEKVLEEINKLKSECLNGEYEPAYGAGALDMANAIKDIIRSLSRENKSEITRCPRDNDGWIPVEERLPEVDGFYIATMDGEIVDQEEPFTGLAEFEKRKWIDDEDDYRCVIAWRPLPEPYRPERSDNHDE